MRTFSAATKSLESILGHLFMTVLEMKL